MLRFRWEMIDAEQRVVLDGFDIGELDTDGRLRRISDFFGNFPGLKQ